MKRGRKGGGSVTGGTGDVKPQLLTVSTGAPGFDVIFRNTYWTVTIPLLYQVRLPLLMSMERQLLIFLFLVLDLREAKVLYSNF